jgi:hypothetical protein
MVAGHDNRTRREVLHRQGYSGRQSSKGRLGKAREKGLGKAR